MFSERRYGFLFSVTLLLILLGPAVNAQQVKIGTSVEATYQPGTKGAKDLERWLAQHAEYRNGQMLGDLSKLGQITVRYVASRNTDGLISAQSIDQPPVPLPATGNKGDTITVSSCGGGSSQTWSYVWVGDSLGGGWQLTSYTYIRTRSCPIGSQ